jgi:hypothetical protein
MMHCAGKVLRSVFELVDNDATVPTFVYNVNLLSESSPANSLPRHQEGDTDERYGLES